MADKDVIDTLIAEAYAEGPEGMRRVAETIINRAAVRGLTLDQVVRQPKQYTGYEHPGAAAKKAQRSPAARSAAAAALQLALQPGDPTGGADHYLNPNVANPSWASKIPSTGSYGNHQFFASRPIPPGEIANVVGTYTDTMPPRAVPPATISPSMAAIRSMTSPSGGDTALQQALAQYAQRQANQVTPAIRRPSLPPMSAPDVNALYAGIYAQPKPSLTNPGAVDAAVQSTSQDPTLAAALARRAASPQIPQSGIERTSLPIGQSIIERGTKRIPPVQVSLTDPGAIDASVNGITQSPALQAALTRAISRPTPVSQSQIERTQLPIGQSQIERTALPRNVPPDLISQSMQRIASANPAKLPPIAPSALGQPPSTRSVQSVAMPALGSAPTRTPPRVTVSTPSTVPQRMAAQDIGNVPRALPQVNPFVPEQRYIEPRNVAPVAPYQGPFVPNKGLERLETPTALSFNPIQQPPAFTTQMRPVQVPNPAWSATPAIPAAGTPMSGGLSRDAVALRAKGLAAAQAMANVPKFITVQQPVRVPTPVPRATSPLRITVNAAPAVAPRPAMTPVQALQARGLTAAQAYAQLNANNGGPRTAADRPGKSLSQMSGQAGMTEGFW